MTTVTQEQKPKHEMISRLEYSIGKMKHASSKEKWPYALEMCENIEYMYQRMGYEDQSTYYSMVTNAFTDEINTADSEEAWFWVCELNSNINNVRIYSQVKRDVFAECIDKSLDAALVATKKFPIDMKYDGMMMMHNYLRHAISQNYDSLLRDQKTVDKEKAVSLINKFYVGAQEILASIPADNVTAIQNVQGVINEFEKEKRFSKHIKKGTQPE